MTETNAAASTQPWLNAIGSRYFLDWLQQQRCSLAFTTYQTGKLFLAHPTNACARQFRSGFLRHGDERQKGGQCEGRMSVEKGATVEEGSEPRGLVMSTSLLGGSKDVDGGAVRIDSAKGAG